MCFNYLQRTRSAQGREDLVGGLTANFEKERISFKLKKYFFELIGK